MIDISLPYGIRDNTLIHISQVESGLKCGCTCPHCTAPLIARKGKVREHHFAHHKSDPCQYALETALHLAAKDILARERVIVLPSLEVEYRSYRPNDILAPAQPYTIDAVRLEQRVGDIIPDVIATIQDRDLFIEVFVTHRVDAAKRDRIKNMHASAVEIDLSTAPRDLPLDHLTELVVHRVENKKWLYSHRVAKEHHRRLAQTITKPTINRGLAVHVDDCPIRARVWHGKPYANVRDDCYCCEHCLDASGGEFIRCDGHLKNPTTQPT